MKLPTHIRKINPISFTNNILPKGLAQHSSHTEGKVPYQSQQTLCITSQQHLSWQHLSWQHLSWQQRTFANNTTSSIACLHTSSPKENSLRNPTESETHAILKAVRTHNLTALQEILSKQPIDINGPLNFQLGYEDNSPTKFTALHVAALFGRTDMAALLIQRGAQLNITDEEGKTPLHIAAYNGKTDTAEFLVRMGADTKIRDRSDRYGNTPAEAAASNGHITTRIAIQYAERRRQEPPGIRL